LLAHGRWFSPASSTTKTGRHDIAKNIAESGVKTPKIKSKSNQSITGLQNQFIIHVYSDHIRY
jgi:hypothetical protein